MISIRLVSILAMIVGVVAGDIPLFGRRVHEIRRNVIVNGVECGKGHFGGQIGGIYLLPC